MKRFILLIAAAVVIAGCNKISISDEPFSIQLSIIQAQAAWVDIVPETNDFHFYYGSVTVEDFISKYGGNDATMVYAIDAEIKSEWEKEWKSKGVTFRDACLGNGAYFTRESDLEPDTDYYLFAFPYDDKDMPIDSKTMKVPYHTRALSPSTIDFSVSLDGSILSIVPTNSGETYYWDYESKAAVKEQYDGSPTMFYFDLIYMYEAYGFIGQRLSKGNDSEDMSKFYNLNPGDEFYLVSAGYNNGTNSPYRIYSVTYAGPDLPGKVEPCDDPYFDSSEASMLARTICRTR